MINVVVSIVVRQGKMQDYLAECARLRPLVLAERGCLAYEYNRDLPSPLGVQEPIDSMRVTLIERWESMDALMEHVAAPHMKEYAARVADMRESVIVRVMEPAF